MFFTLTRWCGFLTALLGAELIAGWLLRNEAMVKILPTSNSVSFNTAIAFVLGGSALMAGHSTRMRGWRKAVAVILMVGASLILFEDIFDISLGLDWESLHRTIIDGSPRPGRVAPNTCVALLLLGILLFILDLPVNTARRLTITLSCSIILALIASGVVGLLLDPTLLFSWYKFNRMAAPTAFGIGLLTLGIYADYRRQVNALQVSVGQQERSILVSGTLILLGMGLAGAATTFIIFANYQQQASRDRLSGELGTRVRMAEMLLAQTAGETVSLIQRRLLAELIGRAAEGHPVAEHAKLQATLMRLLAGGFSSLHLDWADGSPPSSAGIAADQIELALTLRDSPGDTLLWANGGAKNDTNNSTQKGFIYRATRPVTLDSGKLLGMLTTERPVTELSEMFAPLSQDLNSAEVFICGMNNTVACFPNRKEPTPLLLAPLAQRKRLPVDEAVAGKRGVYIATDYRDVNVVAATSPIGATGLAVVSKVDSVELNQPINFLLSRSLLVLLISLAIGLFMLRRMVVPLVRGIGNSQRQSKASEDRAVASERRLKSITDNVPALIGFVDKNLVYQSANRTYEQWFGKPVSEIIGKRIVDVLPENLRQTMLPRIQKALAGEPTRDFTYKTDGTLPGYPSCVTINYIPEYDLDGSVAGFNVLAFDATERLANEHALEKLAYHDSLTGLPNRRMLNDRLQHALARAERGSELIALLYLDIDEFKQINDTHGHECGDLLLQAFANRVRNSVRNNDTVARLGGDEFTIILENVSSAEVARHVAQKILESIRMSFNLDGRVLNVTTSIGIAVTSGKDITPSDFIRRSDHALYNAKKAGRNCFVLYGEAMTTATEGNKAVATSISDDRAAPNSLPRWGQIFQFRK